MKVCKSVFHLLDKERPLLRLKSVQLGGVKIKMHLFSTAEILIVGKGVQVTLTMALLDSRVPAGRDSVTVCQPEQYQ